MNVENTDFEAALSSVSDKTKLKDVFSDKELLSAEEQLLQKIECLNKQLEAVFTLKAINQNHK